MMVAFLWLAIMFFTSGVALGWMVGSRNESRGTCPCGKHGTVELHDGQWRCLRHVVEERPSDITQVIKVRS